MGSDPVFENADNHYSYAAYADPAMAASFDAKRFGGPIGRILLDDQERVLARVSRRRVTAAAFSIWQPAPDARRSRWPNEARSSPASTPRARC